MNQELHDSLEDVMGYIFDEYEVIRLVQTKQYQLCENIIEFTMRPQNHIIPIVESKLKTPNDKKKFMRLMEKGHLAHILCEFDGSLELFQGYW